LLVREVPVRRPGAEPGVPRDVVERRPEPALGEDLARGLDQTGPVAGGIACERS